MSAAPDPGGARLTVLLDLRHPEAYLALGPAARLGLELGVEIDWLPQAVPALRRPSEPGPGDDRGVRHRRNRAWAIAREIQTYGDAQGLVLRELYRDPDTSAFQLGWLWLRAHARPALEAFLAGSFRAYWSLELDPSSVSEVGERIAAVGGDRDAFERWCAGEGPAAAAALAEALAARGLSGVPGYLALDEFFVGRQHLPMIRWILGGRNGPGPI